ncbi:adenylate isopentenyltransferase 3, chloroplastic-like [Coffea arabica]|uniref:adenylate dimethylallyltransferase (ADP/ATP-dependent) n=2 Tax=Coffea TaxID=13442 RepID=A0A6P6SBT8_COFAR|nr:adenylate isopentenyltransferase 3, chloroplastic-like [Coffea arabica]
MTMSSMSMLNPKPPPLRRLPTSASGGLDMQLLIHQRPQRLDNVVVVMGATGTGKSRLSIDLATRFPAEIVNSDKMQVYRGLDIVTNKITDDERRGVPHHLLGVIDPNADFTATSFCSKASAVTKSIVGRGKLPIIVGGSNSFVETLIEGGEGRSRYNCCFLWVDVSLPVLHSFVSERVDRMVEKGMVDEIREIFNPDSCDYSRGIKRSIGVAEFDRYFRAKPFCEARLREEAINQTKANTCKLACRQLDKIIRLRNVKGWKIHRLDATAAFRKRGEEADKEWENLVVGPSTKIVSRFLYNHATVTSAQVRLGVGKAVPVAAAATHQRTSCTVINL